MKSHKASCRAIGNIGAEIDTTIRESIHEPDRVCSSSNAVVERALSEKERGTKPFFAQRKKRNNHAAVRTLQLIKLYSSEEVGQRKDLYFAVGRATAWMWLH
ncbi:hypothetical protein KIN20_012843 [Parelaphostrongylus tenuis]|uniref:Uncharacterized protein n=1 Tax=Parelaphostrongylus tenuis TaxID=148309 RepID=A0AAD5MTW7_PARTN|nr:hypothetical protein KIN20_012843 [Parelaphostrongylus tenuis]